MSLDSTLRGLAAEIGQSRTPTGSVAAPAKLRHRTGTITAYTTGDLTASVQIGGDIVDAPFLATYRPTVGDAVSVLINNGSPLILGPVNKAPSGPSAIVASADFRASDTSGFTGAAYIVDLDVDGGSDPGIWQRNALGQGMDVLVPGWFSAHVAATINGCTAGDVFRIALTNGGGNDGQGVGYSIADVAGVADISADCSIAGYTTGSVPVTPAFQVIVTQVAGTGTTPNLAAVFINLYQYNGLGTLP